ncbi:hypothetical protein FMEAI12_1680010 [Parafrankia sp. Ea1.12]|uniref:acyl-CoA dehydrogenase family protein n=1 Tax=Parafrankia sp. Ea1.12 TaxID=573499 RepID=UPI000DA4C172|nr:acyl-CoA dehydrogenase family protein [Parafrankia sp. Ea1.12]SQD93506.1 hypothetical protein FMEAI12_1680010 [Parafrankia sp. Ea1.12]
MTTAVHTPELVRPELVRPDLSPEALAAVTDEIAAVAPAYDRTGEIPVRGLEAAHRAGLLTATVGTQYGGPGLGLVDTARILVALGEGDASVELLAANNLGTHQAQAAAGYWPEAYYADFLRRSAEGPTLANAVRSAFTRFALERVPTALGRPIATTERIQTVAGEIDAQIAQAETLLFGALLRAEAGDTGHLPQLSLLKIQIARSAIATVNTAVAAPGNPALTRYQPFERLLRDVLCVRVHPPQEDTALLAAGRRLLGQ